ncbi:DUF1430 domain-containing protein [Paenibacillus sp. GCM10012307]|uniref:DUF1430 domain-containing protein n=1 Tax=Paenibacillus roseus TaxID=2798579 RepID=A0A934MX77_9BACL|nr:DUF1430 domain-containing protein [Paenibacillus roseus]MBJ6363897.1 DUF1430 domain-containing protein [Paenibacillus roseus]
MKKVLLTFLLLIVAISLFSFDALFKKQIANILYDDYKLMTIHYFEEERTTSTNVIQELVDFSVDEGVNISRYHFINEHTLHIYSSNIQSDSHISLISGEWPYDNNYISNKSVIDQNQSGTIAFPISNLEVKYFDFHQLRNVGLGGSFYLSKSDNELLERARQAFSSFGEVRFEEVQTNPFLMVNVTLFLVVLFALVSYSIIIFYYMIQNRTQFYLHQLWGYTVFSSFLAFIRPVFKSILIIIVTGQALVITLTIYYNQTYYLIDIVVVSIIISLIMLLVTVVLLGISLFFIRQSGIDSVSLKGSPPFKNYQISSVILKAIFSMILLSITAFSFMKALDLNQKLANQTYWNETKNIYRIQVGPLNISGDLKKEKYLNDQFENLYQSLKINKDLFLIYAANFVKIYHKDIRGKYLFEYNSEGEEQFYLPRGRSIVINENYLKINPILAANQREILDQLNSNPMILNLLVPEKFKKYEQSIKQNYLKNFYFQKVRVNNIYNEELGAPLNTIDITDLDINIIYTSNSQSYFTFNSSLGDPKNKNKIVDPIAIIFNESVDSSFIGAYTTTSLYFYDDSQGNAYNNIIGYLKETRTLGYIPYVTSVYQENNAEIVRLTQQLLQQIVALSIMFILSCAFLIVFVWSYYMSNANQLYLKFLFGYSYWKTNKLLILSSICIYFISGILVFFWLHTEIVILSTLLLIGTDMILIYLYSRYLNRQHMGKILKGESL